MPDMGLPRCGPDLYSGLGIRGTVDGDEMEMRPVARSKTEPVEAEKVIPKVVLWSGHDVNLTIPTEFGRSGQEYAKAVPTLGEIRDFVRAAQDAGYGDTSCVSVGTSGLRVRRDAR